MREKDLTKMVNTDGHGVFWFEGMSGKVGEDGSFSSAVIAEEKGVKGVLLSMFVIVFVGHYLYFMIVFV